jgi:hypothetical protein
VGDEEPEAIEVQEGVNAGTLFARATGATKAAGPGETGPAPVQLTSQEVVKQIQLVAPGYLGRGVTCDPTSNHDNHYMRRY